MARKPAGEFLRDESGAVVSVDFLLTVPVFLTVFTIVVQLSLMLAAQFVVEHAAFAACRSAIVWIGADLPGEPRNEFPEGGEKHGHAVDAAASVCAAVSPRLFGTGDVARVAGHASERLARLPSARYLTDVRVRNGDGGTEWEDLDDVTVTVEHRFVLRVPIARRIGSRLFGLAGPRVWPMQATVRLTNHGRPHGNDLR